MTQHLYSFFILLLTLLVTLSLSSTPPVTYAGCGCEKPPPAPAAVRPNATYQGTPVTLFHNSLIAGQTYTVTFTAMNGQNATVPALAIMRRDLADGVYKPQLPVTVPSGLPLGPVSITVTNVGQSAPFLAIPDSAFTLAPQPIVIPSQPGSYNYQNYQAAVGRDGRVYLSLDVTGITQPRTFKAQAIGWPLRFTKDGAVFYNIQGFVMQLANAPIPGLFSIDSGNSTDSDIAQYARHEFNTYFLQHAEQLPHATDPLDPNWHLDGTRHIDHDHLILTLAGTLNGSVPTPGATPAFTFALTSESFFHKGLVGLDSILMSSTSSTDSYNAATGLFGLEGDVLSNGELAMSGSAAVNGNATATSFRFSGSSSVNGALITATQPAQFIPVAIPNGLPNLGAINLTSGATQTVGPGSYRVVDLTVKDSQLFIDNTSGPVTFYVTGAVAVSGIGGVIVADPDPEKFAIYVASTKSVAVSKDGTFAGVVYAPQSVVTLSGGGEFWGSFIGRQMKLSGSSRVHYNRALRGE